MKLVDPHIRQPRVRRDYAIEPMHPIQIAGYRRMTPAQKIDMLASLYRSLRSMSIAGTRMRHPDWNDEQVQEEVRTLILYGVS